MKKPYISSLFVLISMFGLTSCGEKEVSDTRFESLVEMRDSYIEVGGSCSDWKQENNVTLALESGACGSSNVLSIYSSRAAAEEQNRALKKFIMETFPLWIEEDRKISLLVGENWMLNESNASVISSFQDAFGGYLITSYSEIP
jgi:hypothetical protein